YVVNIGCQSLSNTTPSPLQSTTTCSNYTANITYTGGYSPVTCSIVSGSLPPGLSLSGCSISGTPTVPGTYTFTTRVIDSCTYPGQQYSDKATSITVNCCPFTGWSSFLPNATNCQSYSGSINVIGGVPVYTWTRSGSLPSGINFCTGNTAATCNLTGTQVLSAPGSYSFTVQVTDSCSPPQSTSSNFNITVNPDPCYTNGIQLLNARGGGRDSYRRDGGTCTEWKDGDVLSIMPGSTYQFYTDNKCQTPCPAPFNISNYCNQKSFDTDRDCLTQMRGDCSFADR
ncbi:MAG: Ig domain-containing protein, partial [Thermodesulfovibrionales bacterium]|nr:Ig domain-containing protein [Thermodesulfovibrionales bacterium]